MMTIGSLAGMGAQTQEDFDRILLRAPPGLSNMELAKIMLARWRGSRAIRDMEAANEYYLVRNAAILEKKRENVALSNVRVPSADYRASVENKINYAFGKPFVINVEDAAKKAAKENPAAERYLSEWQAFIDKYLNKVLRRLGKNAINNGIGWAYPCIDEATGDLDVRVVKSETLYPNWTDEAHEKLNFVIRDYEVSEIVGGETKVVNKIEFWDDKVVERYVETDGGELIIDVAGEDMRDLPFATAHMVRGDGENMQAISWGRVPLVALKGSDDELPLLNMVKAVIDAIDMLNSKSVDSLVDDIDAILILKNYSAEMGDIQQARKLVKENKIMSVDADGGAEYLQVKPDITAIQAKLESLHKAAVRAGYDVDYEDLRFGGNPNQLVLRSIFQRLDTYINGLEQDFAVFMNNLKYFFDVWLEFKGVMRVEESERFSLKISLNRDMLINEDNDIKNTLELAKTNPYYTVSVKTIDGYNPMTPSHEEEQDRREKERLKRIEQEQKNSDYAGFANLFSQAGSLNGGEER